jgi:hypothetical protein
METYAALLNLKVLVPSSTANYIAVESHYWRDLLEIRLASIDVDEAWYLTQYPDVATALKNGVVQSASQHYYSAGYYEHRMPYKIDVDSMWYLKTYVDINDAVRQGVFQSAWDHFERLGYQEGRLPHANFALRKRRAMALAD